MRQLIAGQITSTSISIGSDNIKVFLRMKGKECIITGFKDVGEFTMVMQRKITNPRSTKEKLDKMVELMEDLRKENLNYAD